jgi:hypothetical protein
MRPILENIFRFLANKLELFLYDGLFFPRCKKMNQWINESMEVLGGGFGKNESLINQELVTQNLTHIVSVHYRQRIKLDLAYTPVQGWRATSLQDPDLMCVQFPGYFHQSPVFWGATRFGWRTDDYDVACSLGYFHQPDLGKFLWQRRQTNKQ